MFIITHIYITTISSVFLPPKNSSKFSSTSIGAISAEFEFVLCHDDFLYSVWPLLSRGRKQLISAKVSIVKEISVHTEKAVERDHTTKPTLDILLHTLIPKEITSSNFCAFRTTHLTLCSVPHILLFVPFHTSYSLFNGVFFIVSYQKKKIYTTYGKDIADIPLLHHLPHVTTGRISENTLADGFGYAFH
jgi:hypothetical protein